MHSRTEEEDDEDIAHAPASFRSVLSSKTSGPDRHRLDGSQDFAQKVNLRSNTLTKQNFVNIFFVGQAQLHYENAFSYSIWNQ